MNRVLEDRRKKVPTVSKMTSMVKGGIWKNSEDEILKAAVMKYGLNNWARIASLLTRKTPGQCKARWFEWLDPSVKKTEWTRDEDEKLLHLSKIFPTQWRTIAPIVGRTAHHCQERYEKLLDETQGRLTLDEHDPRKLRPGEIDPTPEIRPAKADAVDMDDDEKQMLQEARARLANVHGKKATRKAQEEMVKEAKRLSEMQKEKELRAAGVFAPPKRLKRGEMDYNKEIPFETQPHAGIHDLGAEETPRPSISLDGLSAQKLEGRTKAQEESKQRKEDKERLKKKREAETAEQLVAKAEQETVAFRKINRLVLPDEDDSMDEESSNESETENETQSYYKARSLLRQLPQVENEIELEAPEFEEPEEEEVLDQDRGDIAISGMDIEEARYFVSQSVLRKLPRPTLSEFEYKPGDSDVMRLINQEAAKLLATDALEHPVKGQRPNPSASKADRKKYSLDELKNAQAAVSELASRLDQVSVDDIPFPPAPELTEVLERKLRKSTESKAQKIHVLKEQAKSILAGDERTMLQVDEDMRETARELASVQRSIRTIKLNIPREDAEWNSRLEDMSEKVKREKARNKEFQDKYMRLSQLMKFMNSQQ